MVLIPVPKVRICGANFHLCGENLMEVKGSPQTVMELTVNHCRMIGWDVSNLPFSCLHNKHLSSATSH